MRSRELARRTPRPSSTGSRRSSGETRRTSSCRTSASTCSRRVPGLPALARAPELPLVATGDVHYLDASNTSRHEALLCIQSGDSLKNPAHWRFEANEFYFKTPEEMALDFPGHEDAMRRSLEVAERCKVEIELDRIRLPHFPVPGGRDAFDYLVELCEKGSWSATARSRPSWRSGCGSSSRRSARWALPTTS